MDTESALWSSDWDVCPSLEEAPVQENELVAHNSPPPLKRAPRRVAIGLAIAVCLIVLLLAIFLLVPNSGDEGAASSRAGGPSTPSRAEDTLQDSTSSVSSRNGQVLPDGQVHPPASSTYTTTTNLGDPCYKFVARLCNNQRL